MGNALGKIANGLGFSANGISAGIAAAVANAEGIATKALADAKAATGNVGRAIASGDGSPPTNSENKDKSVSAQANAEGGAGGDEKNNLGVDGKNANGKNAGAMTGPVVLTAQEDMRIREEALKKSREAMLNAMGSTRDMFGSKDADLFGIVHARYQEMRRQGNFNEYGQRMAASIPR